MAARDWQSVAVEGAASGLGIDAVSVVLAARRAAKVTATVSETDVEVILRRWWLL
jgi:hypothetical protein